MPIPPCSNCIHSAFIFASTKHEDIDRLYCKRKHPIVFQAPESRNSNWGWRPAARKCYDFQTILDQERSPRRPQPTRKWLPAYRSKKKHHGGDPSGAPTRAQEKHLPPPNGPYTGKLNTELELPGVREIELKYAAELSAGRQTANRIFGKDQ